MVNNNVLFRLNFLNVGIICGETTVSLLIITMINILAFSNNR